MASSISTAITAWKARKANAARESFLTRPLGLCPLISVSDSLLSLVYRQALIQLRKLGASFPNPPLSLLVVRGFGALDVLIVIVEVLAIHTFDLRRRGQVDRGSCRFLRRHDLPSEPVDGPEGPRHGFRPSHLRTGPAWVGQVDGDPRALEPAGQLVRPERVDQLRPAVGSTRAIVLLRLKVIQVELRSPVRPRAYIHDARRSAPLEHREK